MAICEQAVGLFVKLDYINVSEHVWHSRREDAQQLLPVGNVWYCGLRAMEQPQENGAGMGSVAVDLLCCLLGQATHHALNTTENVKNIYEQSAMCTWLAVFKLSETDSASQVRGEELWSRRHHQQGHIHETAHSCRSHPETERVRKI